MFVLLAGAVAVLAVHASLYYPFISDDALISLRYASRLLSGHGLTWTAGHPVEGYSNLLWVVLVALLGWVGFDLIDAARLLGLLGSISILCFLLLTAVGRDRLSAHWFPATTGLLFISLSAPIAVWTIGGLEQPLVGGLLAASICLMFAALNGHTPLPEQRRLLLGLSGALGLLTITRPDGPIFAAVSATTFLLCGPHPWRARLAGVMGILSFPAILYGGQLLFRYSYYGEWLPNTALVKLTPTAVRRADGLNYIWGGLQALSPFSFLAVAAMVGLLALPTHRGRAAHLLALTAVWSAYVVIIGGDIFPAYRHLVPLIVVFAFALIELCRGVWGLTAGRPVIAGILVTVTLAQFIPFARNQYDHKQSQRAVTERWEWECRNLGLLLKTAFSDQQPVVAVTAAGCLPYWSELPSIDMLGLNDYYLPRHPPPDLGTGFLGHELGDGAYVLRRKPDIIVFSVGSEPSFRSGTELARMPEFHERYVPITAQVEGVETPPIIYFDRYSTTIGIKESGAVLSLPGFFFRSERSRAYLNRNGTLVARVDRTEPLRFSFSVDQIFPWKVQVVGSPPGLVDAHLALDGRTITITLSTNQSTPVEIESVVLQNPSDPGTDQQPYPTG